MSRLNCIQYVVSKIGFQWSIIIFSAKIIAWGPSFMLGHCQLQMAAPGIGPSKMPVERWHLS